jgi:hypothetical protein
MTDSMDPQITTFASLEGFFNELLSSALAVERVELSPESCAYLLQLCIEYADRDALHSETARDERGVPALTWLYQRAKTSAPADRFNAYRKLGDLALMISGFFAPQIERSLVGVGYFVDMGSAAYTTAASLSRGSAFAAILGQLGGSYSQLVEVLTRVAEQTTLPVANDIGATFERWLRNPSSGELSGRLLGMGMIPIGAKEVA